jgi:hypothetical protein
MVWEGHDGFRFVPSVNNEIVILSAAKDLLFALTRQKAGLSLRSR